MGSSPDVSAANLPLVFCGRTAPRPTPHSGWQDARHAGDISEELVHYAVADAVATITLDSPHNRNALSRQLVTELFERLERADADPDVKVVLVRQAGRVFCSGADLAEATTVGMEEGAKRIVELQRLIATMDKPVVTRVEGAVRAGGIGIVAAGDLAVSADDATYALTEVKLGLAAAIISAHRARPDEPACGCPDHVGGETFTGAQAAEYGLVTKAVPAADLDEAVAMLCAQLATGAAQGLRESKRILNADLVRRIDALRRRDGSPQRPAVRLRGGPRGDDGVLEPEAVTGNLPPTLAGTFLI